jgi:hypothetical protein
MPPPAFRKVSMAALCAAIAASPVGLLSQPPQVESDATMNALYSELSNKLAVTAPAVSGLTLKNEIPKVVRSLVSSVPASNVNTLRLEPFFAKLIRAVS